MWARSVSSRSGPCGPSPKSISTAPRRGVGVLGRHEAGQVVHGDRAAAASTTGPSQSGSGPGRSQVDARGARATQVDELVDGVEAADVLRRRRAVGVEEEQRTGSPRPAAARACCEQLAARVGQRGVGDPGVAGQLQRRGRGRCRAKSMPSTGDPVAVAARGTPGAPASPRGTGRSGGPELMTSGPRSVGQVDVGPAAEAGQGQRRAAPPPPGPGAQSSMPASALSVAQRRGCRRRCWRRRGGRGRRAAVVSRRPAAASQRDRGQRARALTRGPRSRRSAAATSGSVGPSPYDGHQRASGQAPQAGFLAWQRRRPCQMRWWLSIVQSRFGNSAPTACSTLTGSVSSVQPKRRDEPPEVGVDGDAGDAEGVAEHDVGGLAADAGQLRPGRRAGPAPAPPWSLDQRRAELEQRLGLGPEEARAGRGCSSRSRGRRRPWPAASG